MLEQLNSYAKQIAKLIYQENKDFFGTEDDLLLFKLTEEDFLYFSNNNEDLIFLPSNTSIICNLNSKLLKENSQKDILNTLKLLIPHEIFALLIKPNKFSHDVSKKTQIIADYITLGLVELYTQKLAEKYKISILKRYDENVEFSLYLLNNIPDIIDKNKMVFQNDFLYMAECFYLNTNKNLYEIFEKKYPELVNQNNVPKLKKDKNGFFKESFIILLCLILGIYITLILLK